MVDTYIDLEDCGPVEVVQEPKENPSATAQTEGMDDPAAVIKSNSCDFADESTGYIGSR
ncbi:MAG: hypothetical protein ACD_15C00161G0004 [uncultured bacterium]|nr:MAG: hypothetical protein ACD_15C00161G0004 [uncultured bacterium]